MDRTRIVFGVFLIALGLVALDSTVNIIPGDGAAIVWPLVLLGLGVWLLVNRPAPVPPSVSQRLSTTALFSGRSVTSAADPFEGAVAVAVFGSVDLDLRAALPAPPGAYVDATAVFGGVKILVPPGWRVVLTGPAIFGGHEDRSQALGPPPPNAPVLHVRALALFGGVEVEARPLPGLAAHTANAPATTSAG